MKRRKTTTDEGTTMTVDAPEIEATEDIEEYEDDPGIAIRERGMEALDDLIGRKIEQRIPAATARLNRLEAQWDVKLEAPVFDLGDGFRVMEYDDYRANRGRKTSGGHSRYKLMILAPCGRVGCDVPRNLGVLSTPDSLGRAMDIYDPSRLCHQCENAHFCANCHRPAD